MESLVESKYFGEKMSSVFLNVEIAMRIFLSMVTNASG
jgi:hypothetical protein